MRTLKLTGYSKGTGGKSGIAGGWGYPKNPGGCGIPPPPKLFLSDKSMSIASFAAI